MKLGDGNSKYLLKSAIEDKNNEIIDYLIKLSKNGEFKLRLNSRSEGMCYYMTTFENEEHPNLLKYFIDKGDIEAIKTTISIITSDCVTFKEAENTLMLCKDELSEKHPEMYISWIKQISYRKEIIDLDVSMSKNQFLCITMPNPDLKPPWIYELAKQDNSSKLIKIIINTEYFKKNKYQFLLLEDLKIKLDEISSAVLAMSQLNVFENVKRATEIKKAIYNFTDNFSSTQKSISSVIPWKGAAKIGENSLLKDLSEKGMAWRTFDSNDIKMLIEYKWEAYGRFYLIIDLCLHLCLVLFFTLYYCNFTISISLSFRSYYRLLIGFVLTLFAWPISTYKFYKEIILLYRTYSKLKFKQRSSFKLPIKSLFSWNSLTIWNVIDMLVYVSITFVIPIIVLCLPFTRSIYIIVGWHYTIATTVCCLWWKLIYYFLPFRISGDTLFILTYKIEF